jgi:tripeptide aminopeptidase
MTAKILSKYGAKYILSPDFKELSQYKGQTLITTDGTTLLGADDNRNYGNRYSNGILINNPEIKHGKIRVGFTPDEEIGRGAHHFDVEKFELNGLTPWMAVKWAN